MAWNLESLLDELKGKLQDHPRWTAADRKRELNRAVNWLILFASSEDDVWEATPVVDPLDSSKYLAEIPLPTDILVVSSVSFNDVPLRELSQKEYVSTMGENNTATGPPFDGYYVRKNRFLNLAPAPGSSETIQLYGIFAGAEMIDDDDEPGIEQVYGEALVNRAAYRLKIGIPGEEKAAEQLRLAAEREKFEAHFNMTRNDEFRISKK